MMWAFTHSLGVFELEEMNGKYYVPSSAVEVNDYFSSEEEAIIYSYRIKIDGYKSEKIQLEKRLKKLDELMKETKKLYNIDELKKTHPEHFLKDIKYKDDIMTSNNLCKEIVVWPGDTFSSGGCDK